MTRGPSYRAPADRGQCVDTTVGDYSLSMQPSLNQPGQQSGQQSGGVVLPRVSLTVRVPSLIEFLSVVTRQPFQ
jgi:hypothetical protein